MFERYTQKARRVIFFARYEASCFGSPYIETEHILLGLIRENRELFRLIPNLQVDDVRKTIEQALGTREKTLTSVDLPLSNESKRVLVYGAEEAERLASKAITPAHLLLALLRETGSMAAKILTEHGANLTGLRKVIATLPPETGEATVTIHGRSYPVSYIESAVKQAQQFFWNREQFTRPNIVVHRKDKRISFDLKLGENAADFELVKGGWKQSRCTICREEFAESDAPERGTGYTNGRDWICTECYEKFMAKGSE